MGAAPEKVWVNRCSHFCALRFLLCVNVQRTLAQNRHSYEPDSFTEDRMFRPDDLASMKPLMERPTPAGQVIYFISAGAPDFPVKIGRSNTLSLPRRLSQMQTALPYKLEVLYVGEAPAETEATLHDVLSRHRLRGEWFARSVTVMQHVKLLNEEDPDWRERFTLCDVRGR
jgi:hypothetical protein